MKRRRGYWSLAAMLSSAGSRAGHSRAEVFDFLGFTHICVMTRMYVHFTGQTIDFLQSVAHNAEILAADLAGAAPCTGSGDRVLGNGEYSKLSGLTCHSQQLSSLTCLRRDLRPAWLYAFRRRGRRHRMHWRRFTRINDLYIPPIFILHPSPDARFAS
jgi:RNA-directed DNA polymerase